MHRHSLPKRLIKIACLIFAVLMAAGGARAESVPGGYTLACNDGGCYAFDSRTGQMFKQSFNKWALDGVPINGSLAATGRFQASCNARGCFQIDTSNAQLYQPTMGGRGIEWSSISPSMP